MRTATVRDLRYRFPRIESWIRNGEPIEITKRGRAIARLVPTPLAHQLAKPDFLAQLKQVWGERVFSAKEVAAMRAAELKAEEG